MTFQIRESVLRYKRDTYLGNETQLNEELEPIDCAVGYSQWGLSPKVNEAFHDFDLTRVTRYGELFYDGTLKLEILARFGLPLEMRKNLFLGHGSFNLAERIIHKLIKPSAMLGIGPQFNEIPSEFIAAGGKYFPVPINVLTGALPLGQLVDQLNTGDYSVLYLDNPNNPLGEFLTLNEVKSLAFYAEQNDVILVVDEAYADFVDDSQSAIHLVDQFSNLAVIRSFSKGLGLAAERIGYMLLSDDLATLYSQLDVPFEPTVIAATLASAVLSDMAFVDSIRQRVRTDKAKIIEKMKQRGIVVLPNHPDVSIFSIYDPNRNIVQTLSGIGVSVEPGSAFINLNSEWTDNYCRIRIPKPELVETLCARLGSI